MDNNIVGQNWQYRVRGNGQVISQGTRTTVVPSGSFTVSVRPADQAGADRIVGQARNRQTGET